MDSKKSSLDFCKRISITVLIAVFVVWNVCKTADIIFGNEKAVDMVTGLKIALFTLIDTIIFASILVGTYYVLVYIDTKLEEKEKKEQEKKKENDENER